MKTPLEKLKKEADAIRLSQAEKAAMWARIEAEMRGASRPAARPVKSTYFVYSWRMVGSFAMLVLIVLGTGTTYAAGGALPGSPLYPLKVGVAEPIKGALAFSNEAKAEFHTEVAQTRLEEAEALAAQGRLTDEVSATLAARITQHVEEVQTIVKKIEEVDPVAALEVTVQVDSSLAAHSEVLAHLGGESSDEATRANAVVIAFNTSSQNAAMGGSGDASDAVAMKMAAPSANTEVSTFGVSVATNSAPAEQASTTASATMEMRLAPARTASFTSAEETMLRQLERRVESRLQTVRSQYNSIKKSLSATTTGAVEARINFFEERIDAAAEARQSGDYELSKAEYNSVLSGVVELSTFLSASKKFNKGILDSLLSKYGLTVGEVKGDMDIRFEVGAHKGEQTEPAQPKQEIEIEKPEIEKPEAPRGIKLDISL